MLAAAREPWLVIDPKPMSGDPAYEVAPMLWNRWDEVMASGDPRTAILDRMFTLVDGAGLDEDRVRAWVTVRMMVNAQWALTSGADAAELADQGRHAGQGRPAVRRRPGWRNSRTRGRRCTA